MWPELSEFAASVGQPLAAVLFFTLALRLLFGRRIGLPILGRRRTGGVEAPPARLAAAFQSLQTPLVRKGDRTVSNLTAAWIAKGAGALDRPASGATEPPPPPPGWLDSSSQAGDSPGQVNVEELLRWGQQAARAGDRLVAYQLFVRALEVDPTSEAAWMWRAGTCERSEESIRCLEQVLLINPGNERARRGLSESKRHLAGL